MKEISYEEYQLEYRREYYQKNKAKIRQKLVEYFQKNGGLEWLADLEINKKGRIIGNRRNIVTLMTHAPQLKGLVVKERFNTP